MLGQVSLMISLLLGRCRRRDAEWKLAQLGQDFSICQQPEQTCHRDLRSIGFLTAYPELCVAGCHSLR